MNGNTRSKSLPKEGMRALNYLKIIGNNNPNGRNIDEWPVFILYTNYAVNNIQAITGASANDPFRIIAELEKKDPGVIDKLANFLWLFKVDSPREEFEDYREITLELVRKIFALRNFFAHCDDNLSTAPLHAKRQFYVDFVGRIFPLALQGITGPGMKSEKAFKMKLMNKTLNTQWGEYEFTRKGLIALICLALYKDEAEEFCRSLVGMNVPDDKDAKPECNQATARTLRELFSHFSFRRGRKHIDAGDSDFMCFSDCINYLNKTPRVSMDYLALQEERDMLTALAEKSNESEDNKRDKYTLHRRDDDRFLAIAAAYCEDFDRLPSLRFKRLDLSSSVGRKKYTFNKEEADQYRNGINRHYSVVNHALNFEFIPENHYGPIQIGSLRSSIGTAEMRRLLFLMQSISDNEKRARINECVKAYFTAYHRVLERMLNTDSYDNIFLDDDYLADFSTISGVDKTALAEDLSCMDRYFPDSITRYFTHEDYIPERDDLIDNLRYKLSLLQEHDHCFMTRMEKFKRWRRTPRKDDEKPAKPPVCTAEEIPYGNRECRFSDGELIHKVFDYFNLFLAPQDRFRQLPHNKQHRGITDHEYQLIHAAIGKFNLDPKSYKNLLEKRQRGPSLKDQIDKLEQAISHELDDERQFLRRNPRYDKNGKFLGARPTLHMLAVAAVACHWAYCETVAAKYNNPDAVSMDELLKDCARFGVKPRREAVARSQKNLITAILKIDMDKWANSYDYANKSPFNNRKLDSVSHIVSQIPFPNGFAAGLISKITMPKNLKRFISGTPEVLDFNRAFKEYPLPLKLRRYYDTRPLIDYIKSHPRSSAVADISAPGINVRAVDDKVNFSSRGVDNAIRAIKEVENQDKMVLAIAYEYLKRYRADSAYSKKFLDFAQSGGTTVYEWSAAEFNYTLKGGITIKIRANDLTKPSFRQMEDHIGKFSHRLPANPTFAALYEVYRVVTAEDRRKRLEIIPRLVAFDKLITIPDSEYSGKSPDERREMEYRYYRKEFPSLSWEEYNTVADCRNAVFHKGVGLDIKPASKVLARYKF